MAQELSPSNISQRLLKEGAEQLSKRELLAILMETTSPAQEMKTINLANQLLEFKMGLSDLFEIIDNWRCHAQGFEKSN
jgi:DNA repair protein RadC